MAKPKGFLFITKFKRKYPFCFVIFVSMKDIMFSIVVPVFNRPEETEELLTSIANQTYDKPFEVVIVEDGSTITSEDICNSFSEQLNIKYLFKANSGPGDSRNYGMQKASGNYFIILDSDCILPNSYLQKVALALELNYVSCFGGPDAAHESFSDIQKAINYSMTSLWTTGGIRGNKKATTKFQPRSFNMGIAKDVFEKTGGFGKIHPGEDPDLTIRIWNLGFETAFIEDAFVYHKRRISWKKFYQQVYKFGLTRPILNTWHPHTKKLTFWFPSFFILGLLGSIVLSFVGFSPFLWFYVAYLLFLCIDSLLKSKNIKIAFLSIYATLIQFFGYGYGFLKSTILLLLSNKTAEETLPKVFFK